jgi:hypothetical protein
MKKANKEKRTTNIMLDPRPRGEFKALTGADHDDWSLRVMNVLSGALPGDGNSDAISAASSGMLDMKPTDPIEGMLIAQTIAAHEAAMRMYGLGWLNGRHFEASTKYLALADKAARTVAMLTERLDQHRGRGQQQITVKHVTVNADQAIVADQVVSGRAKEAPYRRFVQIRLQTHGAHRAGAEGDCLGRRGRVRGEMSDNLMHKAHAAPRCKATSKRSDQPCRAPAVRGWKVCRMHGARGGAPKGKRNGNYRHGARTKDAANAARLVSLLGKVSARLNT